MSSNLTRRINDHILSQTCSHLVDFRSRNGSKPFRALQDCLRVKPPGGRAAIRRDADQLPSCSSCRKVAPSRLYACMACAAVSCHVHLDYSHATAHAEAMPPGHEIAVDVDRAELFCCACRDQVYDRDFDAAVVLALAAASTLGSPAVNVSLTNDALKQLPTPPPPPPENLRKRRRVDYRPWSPDLRERVLMATNSSPLDNTETNSCLYLPQGLRGLNNLGNTCFMNSVLQALLHTPPLRNYFLSDRHNRYFCQRINNAESGSRLNGFGIDGNEANGRKNTRTCLSCDLDAMFSAGFSGDRTPYSPAQFLFSWWQYAANLASYEQQDAHDFFISILDGIHEKVGKDRQKPQSLGNGECCIAHRVFSGILRSDVMCMACGFTSTTYDPCVDISLDLEPTVGKSGKMVTKSNLSCNGETNCTPFSQNGGISTLMGCLDRFTRPEKLGSDQKFFCQQCQVRQESLKQMSIRKLPLVSCFHIKRFEHSSVRKMSRKINSYLQFPFSLNMAPYLSSSILRSRLGNRIFPFDDSESDPSTDLSSEFELFAIITHTGKLDAGHYVTYLRLSNQWYKCDDAWITQVSENIVRAAQGYMMFYVQKMLYYKAKEKQQAT